MTEAGHTALKLIETRMASTIKKATTASVEVTMAAAGRWTVSGAPAEVEKAAPVMTAAGLVLVESIHDDELGETFAYWHEAA